MFDTLTRGFQEAKNRLAGLTTLDEKNIAAALKEVRRSLLQADVELSVIKDFLARVEDAALGKAVHTRAKNEGQTFKVSAAEQFVKICHDELVATMREGEEETLTFKDKGITGILMVGLQGSGKTTSSAKLAFMLKKEGRKPLLVAADMQRPAAVEQLKVLGAQIEVPVFNLPGQSPLAICEAAHAEAKAGGHNVIIYDTAGRLAIDAALMDELAQISKSVDPDNSLLVIDSMIGQDSVKTARSFNDLLDLSGVILTKLDSDTRGGAALNVLEITGAPVLFEGSGETVEQLKKFRPEGMASRVLGMGDVVGLAQDLENVIDEKQAKKEAEKMLKGQFTLDDFLNQIRTIQKMGPMKDILEKMPGMSQMLPPGAASEVDDGELPKIESMIQSMTRFEKQDPNALVREPGRVTRIAKGSGREEKEVSELVQKFLFMQQMMGSLGGGMGGMGGGGGGGGGMMDMLGNLPGMKGLNMARNMRRAMKSGKMPPGMPDLSAMMGGGGGMPDLSALMGGGGMPPGFPNLGGDAGGPGVPKMKVLTKAEKNARKNQRKSQKQARKRKK